MGCDLEVTVVSKLPPCDGLQRRKIFLNGIVIVLSTSVFSPPPSGSSLSRCIFKQSRVACLLICVTFRWQRDLVPRINPAVSTTQDINPDPSTTYHQPVIATQGPQWLWPLPPSELYFNCIHLEAVCQWLGRILSRATFHHKGFIGWWSGALLDRFTFAPPRPHKLPSCKNDHLRQLPLFITSFLTFQRQEINNQDLEMGPYPNTVT